MATVAKTLGVSWDSVYRAESWPLRMTAFRASGAPFEASSSSTPECKSSSAEGHALLLPADVAGPCCIEDVLTPHQRAMPDVHEDDFLLIHDTGAYYHSSWSYYNCRQTPALYCFYEPAAKGAEDGKGGIKFELIRPMATVEETVAFFESKPASGSS